MLFHRFLHGVHHLDQWDFVDGTLRVLAILVVTYGVLEVAPIDRILILVDGVGVSTWDGHHQLANPLLQRSRVAHLPMLGNASAQPVEGDRLFDGEHFGQMFLHHALVLSHHFCQWDTCLHLGELHLLVLLIVVDGCGRSGYSDSFRLRSGLGRLGILGIPGKAWKPMLQRGKTGTAVIISDWDQPFFAAFIPPHRDPIKK